LWGLIRSPLLAGLIGRSNRHDSRTRTCDCHAGSYRVGSPAHCNGRPGPVLSRLNPYK
jgi:hypothetical protein